MQTDDIVAHFRNPLRLYRRSEVVGRSSAVPPTAGIYGWYFDELPGELLFREPRGQTAFRLLYVGIAPGGPPRGPWQQSNLRIRIRTHARGTADASTLRLTLGCLMSAKLNMPLIRTPSGRWRFDNREEALNRWLEVHARVSFLEMEAPWDVERDVIHSLDLPLNRAHNQAHPFYPLLGAMRSQQKASARQRCAEAGLAAGLEVSESGESASSAAQK